MSDLQFNRAGLGSYPALVLVDMIYGFTDPSCPLGSDCDDVVAANQELLDEFRARKLPIVFTTVVYHNDRQASVFRRRLPALNVLAAGSKWVTVDARLAPLESELLIEKNWASGFFGTKLHERLQAQSVDSLVVTGLTTSGCVRATAVDGLQHNYQVVVAKDACGDRNQSAHRANLDDLNAKYADVECNATIVSMLAEIESRQTNH